jgi:predicted metal-dependent phosphoesterase TrpH
MTPSELIDHAKAVGLGAIAVTDHDTAAGLDEAAARGMEIGQKVIPGIEITTIVEGCDVHIIGLFIDYKQPDFIEAAYRMSKTRDDRNFQMIDQLAAAGINIKRSDLDKYKGCILTKAHIGAVLIERGYASDLKEAIAKYMAKGTVGYVQRVTPSPKECVDMIHNAGGLALVAHTNQIDKKDRDHSAAICKSILLSGADGLETLYTEYDDDWRERTEALASELKLLRSGGSDFHGSYKKNLNLMTGYGDLAVPYSFVEAMEEKLSKVHRI